MKQVYNFLSALSDNNNREWFDAHRGEYHVARAEFEAFIERMIGDVAQFDPAVAGQTPRSCCYRINRDTRFSKDKTPYKNHFGAFISEGGKSGGLPGYYFHVEPRGGGMVGGNIMCAGIYCPDPKVLRSIREDIEFAAPAFLAVLKSASEQGLEIDRDNTLSRVPTGFPKESPMAEYLRLKDLSVYRYFDNNFLLSEELYGCTLRAFRATAPLVSFLSRAAKLVQ